MDEHQLGIISCIQAGTNASHLHAWRQHDVISIAI